MTTRLILRLVIADHLPLERRQKIRELLGRVVREGITTLIEKKRLEIGEVLVAGEFLSVETTEPVMKGHRTSRYQDGPPMPELKKEKRDTGKRYPLASKKSEYRRQSDPEDGYTG